MKFLEHIALYIHLYNFPNIKLPFIKGFILWQPGHETDANFLPQSGYEHLIFCPWIKHCPFSNLNIFIFWQWRQFAICETYNVNIYK